MSLSRGHKYYTQVQIAMRCAGRQWCDFAVWWPNGLFVTRIEADAEFQTRVIAKCEAAFFDVLLPTSIVYERCRQIRSDDSVIDLSKVSDFLQLRNDDVRALDAAIWYGLLRVSLSMQVALLMHLASQPISF